MRTLLQHRGVHELESLDGVGIALKQDDANLNTGEALSASRQMLQASGFEFGFGAERGIRRELLLTLFNPGPVGSSESPARTGQFGRARFGERAHR